MSALERYREHKEKQEKASLMPETNTEEKTEEKPVEESAPATPQPEVTADTPPPAVQPSTLQNGSGDEATQPSVTSGQDNTPAWVKAGSYEEVVKTNPNWSRAQYLYELSKYRREQGLPELSYPEMSVILKDKNPYETEAERKKRENKLKRAAIINGVGSVLGNLVNYVRAKNGHVAMNLSDGTEGYNRLERIRQGQELLGRSYAKDYLGAIAQDRAERAKEAAAAAAAEQRERDYRYKTAKLEMEMENAKSERARQAAADGLAKLKFEYQQAKDAKAQEETRRHNLATESIARERAKNAGKNRKNGSDKYLELETSEGKKRYSPSEHGSNWVHKAYQEMLKQPGGKSYAVKKAGGMFGSNTPTEQEMYEAITRYNESRWMEQHRSTRYGGGSGSEDKPPLE